MWLLVIVLVVKVETLPNGQIYKHKEITVKEMSHVECLKKKTRLKNDGWGFLDYVDCIKSDDVLI